MPNILCTTDLNTEESVKIAALSVVLNKTPEEVIRMAVQKFSAACVPTHAKKTRAA